MLTLFLSDLERERLSNERETDGLKITFDIRAAWPSPFSPAPPAWPAGYDNLVCVRQPTLTPQLFHLGFDV